MHRPSGGANGQSNVATILQECRKILELVKSDLQHFAPKTPRGDRNHSTLTTRDQFGTIRIYEGVSRSWSFNTQHDFAGLVDRCEKAFEKRLDTFFSERYRATKETFMHIPLLYHYANRPDKSSLTLRTILSKAYSTARNGIPDNEDMGCHSAFYICGMLGLYPMMGQDWYFLTAPGFTSSRIILGESGAKFVIEAPKASPDHVYIATARLNGEPIDRAWIYHHEIKTGGHLTLDLSTTPTPWGTSGAPPSPMQHRGVKITS